MSARVLIIDDNAANLELMAYLLKAGGHATLESRDGEGGLKAAEMELPDLILCDVQMPKLDGYALARSIKSTSTLCDIPLVAVSALAMAGDRVKALAAGFDGYLTKPIEPETFVEQVQAYLQPELRCAPMPGSSPTGESPQNRRLVGCTVLVIDDHQAELDFCCGVLERVGYSVIRVDAQHALDLAREAQPALVISDVLMARGSGYDLMSAFKSEPRFASIPFVFVTSTMANEKERRKGLALGAARFLFQPIEPQALLANIESCLSEHNIAGSRSRSR